MLSFVIIVQIINICYTLQPKLIELLLVPISLIHIPIQIFGVQLKSRRIWRTDSSKALLQPSLDWSIIFTVLHKPQNANATFHKPEGNTESKHQAIVGYLSLGINNNINSGVCLEPVEPREQGDNRVIMIVMNLTATNKPMATSNT